MYTKHSIERANERTKYHGITALRFIENGILRGKGPEDFKQDERRFLSELARNGCTVKAYNGFCFIISPSGECVTLYQLPPWFGKKRHYDGKKRIRNAKKYFASIPS